MTYLVNQLQNDTVVSLTRVQQNDAALDTAISGNLTQANLSSATQIPNSMLANPNVEEVITLRWGGTGGTVLPSSSTTVPLDCVPIYGSATYTILNATYTYTSAAGAGTAGSIRIDAGTINVSNVFASSTNLVASTALAEVTGTNQTKTAALTLANSTFTAPIQIALLPTNASATTTPRLVVTLIVKRALQ